MNSIEIFISYSSHEKNTNGKKPKKWNDQFVLEWIFFKMLTHCDMNAILYDKIAMIQHHTLEISFKETAFKLEQVSPFPV